MTRVPSRREAVCVYVFSSFFLLFLDNLPFPSSSTLCR